jgi:hypothetical protein
MMIGDDQTFVRDKRTGASAQSDQSICQAASIRIENVGLADPESGFFKVYPVDLAEGKHPFFLFVGRKQDRDANQREGKVNESVSFHGGQFKKPDKYK